MFKSHFYTSIPSWEAGFDIRHFLTSPSSYMAELLWIAIRIELLCSGLYTHTDIIRYIHVYISTRVPLDVMAKTFFWHFKCLAPIKLFLLWSIVSLHWYLLVAQWVQIFLYCTFFAKIGAFGQICFYQQIKMNCWLINFSIILHFCVILIVFDKCLCQQSNFLYWK